MNNKKGISLITLVVTIIIIIILAGVIIISLVKSNPINSATVAKVMNDYDTFCSDLALYESKAVIKNNELDIKTINTPPYDIEVLISSMKNEKFHSVYYRDIFTVYKGELVLRIDKEIDEDESIKNKEKTKKVRDEVEEILGLKRRDDEETLEGLDNVAISLYYSDGEKLEENRYTNENITAVISSGKITSGYHLEYYDSNGDKWIELTEEENNVTIPNNCYIIARIINKDGDEKGRTETYTINVIDKIDPVNVKVIKEERTETGFKVNISAEDIEEDGYVASGIKEYDVYILKDGEEYQKETITGGTYTLDGIDMLSSYEAYVVARDNALNETKSDIELLKFSSREPSISVNKKDETEDEVVVKIGIDELPDGANLEYSTDGGNTYTKVDGNETEITVTENTTIKTKVTKDDEDIILGKDKVISNINKVDTREARLTNPKSTTHSITLKATAKNIYPSSYEFHIGDKVILEKSIETSKEILVEGLESGTDYACYVIIKDASGSKTTSEIITASTKNATYKITYYANNYNDDKREFTKTQHTDYSIRRNMFTYEDEDYEFVNWNTQPNGTGTDYYPEDKYTEDSTLELYAQWMYSTSTLIVDPNGGSITVGGKKITDVESYTQKANTTLSYSKPTMPNVTENLTHTVTFNYNGNGTENTEATAVETIVYKYDGYLLESSGFKGTLSSNTTSGTYRFPSIGGNTDKITAYYEQSIYSDTIASIKMPVPTREGYIFAGWYTEDDVKISTSSYKPTKDVELKAKWLQNVSSLTVDPNGGSISITINNNEEIITEETKYVEAPGTKLTYKLPTKEDDVTETKYVITYNYNGSGHEDTTDTAIRTTTIKYTGKFTKSATFKGTLSSLTANGTYTFSAAGNDVDVITATYTGVTTNETTEITLAEKTERDGYVFKGWNTKADGTGTTYGAGTKYTPTENITLYAIWKKAIVITATDVKNEPKKYIGQYVNYVPINDCKDHYGKNNMEWRIFYSDGANIYLISKDTVKNKYILSAGFTYASGEESYGVGSKIDRDDVINRLTNANYYTSFKDAEGKALSVTGTPTLEQFVDSYNMVHDVGINIKYVNEGEVYKGTTKAKADGYVLKFISDTNYDTKLTIDRNENLWDLYSPYICSMAIASKCAFNTNCLFYFNSNGMMVVYNYYSTTAGCRPLIKLNTNVKLKCADGDSVWEFN